ncbi:MAG: hydrogenobyrinic acid a,c-diamide synthase (glutamine-hydrolyzing) [Betaproteobacteria bacterium]|nr:hydrogenobyrinic acid a,c-diamide synthase (glutamine-hydrolyzing) [Betaproteobacteria bacterium]
MSHRFLVSAAHKSSGKTTVSVGLAAAFRARGLSVQPFKKGPDYIDPLWLTQAAGRACRNLDLYLMREDEIEDSFQRHGTDADVCLVEGNKGLYDGLALDGSNSNAALAKLLDLPVVLVIDARGMTRGIAPLILGYQAFDRDIRIAGVILNQLGGSRHEAKLRAVVEHYTDVPVLGAVHHDPGCFVEERHLGLVPGNETLAAETLVRGLGEHLAAQVDLDRLLEVTQGPERPALVLPEWPAPAGAPVRIGIARDRAFGFYYADDLDALTQAGAVLVPIDTLQDERLPALDGLYIGGGFPERFAPELAANGALRGALKAALEGGLPAYAECGGLMYLSRSLTVEGATHPMVGAIPGDVVMHRRPVGRGYVHLSENPGHPWPRPRDPAQEIRAHEFHYSSLENLPPDSRFAYQVKRGHGIDGQRDGLMVHRLLASYTHLRTIGGCAWARRFVAYVRSQRAQPAAAQNAREREHATMA